MRSEEEYVFGTHDEEIARLGLQHQAWRARAFAAWQSARIHQGLRVLDVGCGPGYASVDLAELVGTGGDVIAIDKSRRFLDVLESACGRRELRNVRPCQVDLDNDDFPNARAERVWCRWVLSFVKRPREVLEKMAGALEPEGSIVLHEYYDYATWRGMPPCPEIEEFVSAVMKSWRETGSEPDIALQVTNWMEELGLEIREIRPIVDVVETDTLHWAWLRAFIDIGRQRLVELGFLETRRAEAIWRAFVEFEAAPNARMITPAVLQVVARRAGIGGYT
jgi:SAM-dependent methyltransferase